MVEGAPKLTVVGSGQKKEAKPKAPSPAEVAWRKNEERLLGKILELIKGQHETQGHSFPTVSVEKLQKGPEMQRLYEDLYMACPNPELRFPATQQDPTYERAKIINDKMVVFWDENGSFHQGLNPASHLGWVEGAVSKIGDELKRLQTAREEFRKQVGGAQSDDQELIHNMEVLRQKIATLEADLKHAKDAAKALSAYTVPAVERKAA